MRSGHLKKFCERFVAVAAITTWLVTYDIHVCFAEWFGIYAVMMYGMDGKILHATKRPGWKGMGQRRSDIILVRNNHPNITALPWKSIKSVLR
jgi:hypothetical protein